MNTQQQVKQLAIRLENATNTERIEALEELNTIAKQYPDVVGEFSLKKILDFLKQQGSSEEYQEALDLIYRLVKCKDKTTAKKNTDIISEENKNIELLLDLLGHEDSIISVTSSQILTEMHGNDRVTLEAQIQLCPDGINKLLLRLPDSSREEVRDQAIVLIQQLTASNDEIKKNVVFSEGFTILFDIISSEGGANGAGLVVQDCLQICNNLLTDSGSCQRLFFEMGGVDLILKLAAFFDPLLLESKVQEEDGEITPWFQQNTRLACAVLAIASLYNSLLTPAKKFQMMTVNGASLAVPSMAFWIARKGPLQLVSASLSLLLRLLEDNKDVAKEFLDVSCIVSPAQLGRNIPHGTEPPTLHFSWRPSLEDERRMISLPAVLVERYIFSSDAWSADDGLQLSSKLVFDCAVGTDAASFSQGCLSVFEKILSGNPSNSDLLVQFILAAPPPDADMDGQQRQLETMKPLGSQVLNLLVEGCQKVIGSSSQQQYGGLSAQARVDMVVTERAANVLTLVFVYGSVLARELATVLTTQHTSLADLTSSNRPSALLPLLLASAGRAAKLPSGAGSSLLVAILRLLAAVVTGCERATKAMLEDPSNLFVVDLATTASESAGVPPLVQVSASFFLACAFDSFEEDKEGVSGAKESSGGDAGMLNKKSFLAMIDGRIGLTRFTELLKKPLVSSSRRGEGNAFSDLFVTAGFRAFYEERVEAVRSGIFSFYAGVTAGGSIDAAHQKMLDMQQERIAELEQRLSASRAGLPDANHLATDSGKVAALEQQVQSLQEELGAAEHLREQHSAEQDAWLAREQELVAHNAALVSAQESFTTREQELVSANATLTVDCQKMWTQLNDSEAARRVDFAKAVELEEKLLSLQAAHTQLLERSGAAELLNREVNAQLQQLRTSQGGSSEEVLALKQTIVSDSDEKKRLQDLLTQRDRKIELLQGELAELSAKNDTSGLDRKILELEGRNAELKQQLWDVESQLQSARSEAQNQTVAPSADGNEAEEVLERLSQAVTQLVYNLGVEVEGMDSIQMRLLDTQLAASRRCDLVDLMLAQVSEAVLAAVNDCSDLSEGVRIYNLQGKEGSVERFVDCCRQLSGAVRDLSEKAEECDALRDQLEAAERLAESLRDQMDPVEGAVEALKEQLGVEEQTNDELRDQLVVAQQSTSSLEEDLCALRDDKARMQTELNALMDQHLALTERERGAAAECERLQAQLRNHTSAGQTEDSLRSQIDELTKVNSDLDRQMSALTTQNLSIAGLTEEIATLNDLLRQSKVDFESERESLVTHLQQTQHDQQAVELQLRETAALASSLTASNSEQQTEIDLLRRQLHAASISHSEAAAEQHLQQITALQREKAEEVAALTRQIGVLSEQQAVAQQTIEELQAAREQSDVRCAEALERVSDLESGLDQRQSVVNSMEQRVESLSQLAQSHSDAVADLEARLREAAAVCEASEATIAALNQEVQRLTAALNSAEAATGELLAKQTELFGENAALLDSKTKLAEYQKQVNQLNVVIADFDARLQHESKASEAALLAEKSASASLLDKIAEQQVQATQLQIELSESAALVQSLQTQLSVAGQQLEQAIADRSLLEDEVSRRTIASVAMTTELEEARVALQAKDQELVAQREAFDRERQALEDHNKLMVSMDPFQSQDKELRRLSGIADKLAKDLFGKESELKAVQLQLRRREGEMAGVKVTIEALHADLETARSENESLLTRAGADARQLKELAREISALEAAVQLERGEAEGLRAQLQSEKVKAQFAETVETQHSELMARVEVKLRELMSSSKAVPVQSGVGAVELVDHLRSHVEATSAQLTARIQTLSEALEAKERQLVEEIQKAAVAAASAAAAIAAANSAAVSAASAHSLSSNNAVTLFDRNMTNMTTPSKKTSSSSANKSIDLSNGMLTPIHSHETSLSRNTHGELTVTRSGRNGHGKSSALTVSPGAKDAARLNAEVLRERRKLNTLQEQHSDLLGLLAQQEVELKVFRKTLETRLGQTELHDAEGEAQEQVIHMYGSYTNFRHYDLLD